MAESSHLNYMPVTVYLGLGSNLGDRLLNLRKALELLANYSKILRVSPVYQTLPVGNTEQPLFLNLACAIATALSPEELLTRLKKTETEMGRKAGLPNSPRIIDIDILFYGDLVIDSPNLKIPHPRLVDRAFVMVPLADIAPDFNHPVVDKTVQELLAGLKRKKLDTVPYIGN